MSPSQKGRGIPGGMVQRGVTRPMGEQDVAQDPFFGEGTRRVLDSNAPRPCRACLSGRAKSCSLQSGA
jgi:hypothetical protein